LIALDLFMQGLIVSIAWNVVVPAVVGSMFGVEAPEMGIAVGAAIAMFMGIFKAQSYKQDTKGMEIDEVTTYLWGTAIGRWIIGFIGIGLMALAVAFI